MRCVTCVSLWPKPATPPEAAFVYTAVLKKALVDAWSGRGESGFRVIFVDDGVVPRAATSIRMEDPRRPFAADLKAGMRFLREQGDLPPIEFVAEREAALRGPGAGRYAARVKNKGLLVSLGRIRATPKRAEVGAMLWVDVKAMEWLTYVVKEKQGGWRVVGTTGPVAIS